MPSSKCLFLLVVILLVLLPSPAAAFGAGNIASISKVEGHNWRHGDIEDMLKTVACLRGHKWTSMMIKRVYFGNWLRDYSQAVDVGTLKGVQADTIRILVWILAFMSFGYATAEFEVTSERLGTYRPEEHIDNPKDYADNVDARKFDPRLRGPVFPEELAVDPNTGMKNYIANEYGGWATSAGYIKFSFSRSIHYGRMYTHGPSGSRGKEEDLCEALRCLGQGLHCLEDFGAHTNYTELALRELGFTNVFAHTGSATQINLHGKYVFPLVTGTFGGVDFLHSVLGEATDHFTQSEIDEMNVALGDASSSAQKSTSGGSSVTGLTDVLSKIPGTGGLCQEAFALQASADAQAAAVSHARSVGNDPYGNDPYNTSRASIPQQPMTFDAPPGTAGGPPGPGIPGMNPNLDPATIIPKIYPILAFRDKVVRSISAIVAKIPGLEKLIETITERVTLFVLSLLAPFIQPIINAASEQLKLGSSAVVESSANHQYEPWTDPHCTDPTHSLLSKDHFSNVLNEPAGQVAAAILQYVAPRVIYAWDHPDVPVDQVLNDVVRVFHHPAIRDNQCEVHRNMFDVVRRWVDSRSDRGYNLNNLLSSESVKAGKNHSGHSDHSHGQGDHSFPGHGSGGHGSGGHGSGGHGNQQQASSFSIPGMPNVGKISSPFNLLNRPRDVDFDSSTSTSPYLGAHAAPEHTQQTHQWGAFQPYNSQYAGGQPGEPYHGGQFQGGQGAEPSYTVQTAYQQGYEVPYQQPQDQGGYGQMDYQHSGYGGTPGQHDPNAPPLQGHQGGHGGGYSSGYGGTGY
ncbi:heterokaryon incompatibility Het-C [Lepidopterella palustris CBS 459.81]|uniref:Heterokaryon incompatibility Het-C n=1 Tax=Lepidopterella palustris CBS 459.81 TaxID=1314670 RepID=A0A8E2JHA8_9PEZI|nr:heterokaryon incompatibility Het-C [Lepidopterella palustris CBS 459.81]